MMLASRRAIATTSTTTIRSSMIHFPTTTTTRIVAETQRQRGGQPQERCCLRLFSSWPTAYDRTDQQQQQQPPPKQQHQSSSSSSSSSTPPTTHQQQQQQRSLRLLRPIYVSATRQHVGKTSTCLALLSGLQKRFDNKVGFMKPVGQISLTVPDDEIQAHNNNDNDSDNSTTENHANNNKVIHVDKDAALIKQHFALDHVTYRQSNPVLIPKGYTRDYINGQISQSQQQHRIVHSYREIAKQSHSGVVLCEGTGHVAVGSIVDASNAQVAAWLGARMILVANGGLGQTMDELELNRAYLLSQQDRFSGTELAGVIINKVKPEKYEQTKHYISKALEQKWGGSVPLIGCIPDRLFLGCPALADIERLLKGSKLVSGREHLYRHYTVGDGTTVDNSGNNMIKKGNNLQLVSTSLEVFLKDVRRDTSGRTLYVSHASRNDILLGFLMESQNRGPSWEAAMIVTGCAEYPISNQVMEIVTSMQHQHHATDNSNSNSNHSNINSSNSCLPKIMSAPVLMAPQCTQEVMHAIHTYTPKLHAKDPHRVQTTIDHYEPYIDFDLLLNQVGYYIPEQQQNDQHDQQQQQQQRQQSS
jgi:BioD-like phosphotransacetylase family protein